MFKIYLEWNVPDLALRMAQMTQLRVAAKSENFRSSLQDCQQKQWNNEVIYTIYVHLIHKYIYILFKIV